MSGGWGEGRADCAQANSYWNCWDTSMTRLWDVYNTLMRRWDFEFEDFNTFQHICLNISNTFQPKVSVVPVSTRFFFCSPLNLVNSALNRSSGNGMQRLEVTRQRALRPGPRNLRKHVKNCWKIGLQIGVNDLQGKNMLNCYQAIFRNYWTSTLHVQSFKHMGLIRDSVYSVWGCHEWTIQMAQTSRPCVSRVWNQV